MEGLKEAITATCNEFLGTQKDSPKPWKPVESLNKVEDKNEKKAVLNSSRTRSEKIESPSTVQ